MKARVTKRLRSECPDHIAQFLQEGNPGLTLGREYEIHAVALSGGIVFFLHVDDFEWPAWHPAFVFEVVDRRLPDDWQCNVLLDGEPQLIIGPEFVSQSRESYMDMVDLKSHQQVRFWNRVDSMRVDDAASHDGAQ